MDEVSMPNVVVRHALCTTVRWYLGLTLAVSIVFAAPSGGTAYAAGDAFDWQAKWITASRMDKDPLPIFRKAVQLDEPIKQAVIHICGLGHYDSIHGRIESRWRIEEGRFFWQITVPPNTTAEVHVPTKGGIVEAGGLGDGSPLILESTPKQARSAAARRGLRVPPGSPASQAQGITFLRMEPARNVEGDLGRAVFKVGPGSYDFRSFL